MPNIPNFRIQHLRGTSIENDAYTGRDGEVTIDKSVPTIRIHDGVTTGGVAIPPGKSAYELAVDDGFVGTLQQWLDSLKGADGVNGQDGVGGSTNVTVNVLSWGGNNFSTESGVTVQKEYSDSSIRINHNQGKMPTGWFAVNKESNPMVGIFPSSTRNIQIVDMNTVIITNMSSFEVFDVVLHF